jgi:hypothetical protein
MEVSNLLASIVSHDPQLLEPLMSNQPSANSNHGAPTTPARCLPLRDAGSSLAFSVPLTLPAALGAAGATYSDGKVANRDIS